MAEQVAIISEVGIGCRDVGTPVLWFTVHTSESLASLQVLPWSDAYEVLQQIREVQDLDGRPCWVECDGNMVKFVRLWSK